MALQGLTVPLRDIYESDDEDFFTYVYAVVDCVVQAREAAARELGR